VIKWPKRIPAGSVSNEIALTMDLLPTLAAITGSALPKTMRLDGKNIIDLLTAKQGAKSPHDYFYYIKSSRVRAVRNGDWKYHQKEIFAVKETKRNYSGPTLYNLKEDIGESNNLIEQYPEIAKRLNKKLEAFAKVNGLNKTQKSQ